MPFAAVDSVIGSPPIQFSGLVADAAARLQPGQLVTASDNWWGTGEFIYAKAAGTIRAFGLCVLTPAFNSTTNTYDWNATEVPNTANLGRMLCVSAVALTSGQFSWFQVTGLCPVNCQASVAADATFGIAAAGQGGANSAGKQILNARVVAAATTTVAKTNSFAQSGSAVLTVSSADGWFPGAFLSGTGIAAATTVSSIDPSGRFVTLSAVTTAPVTGTVTATYNNAAIFYNVAHLNRPFAQGAIT